MIFKGLSPMCCYPPTSTLILTVDAQEGPEIIASLGHQQPTGHANDTVHLSAQTHHFSPDLEVKYSADAELQLWVASTTASWSRRSAASQSDILDFPSLYQRVLQAGEGTT